MGRKKEILLVDDDHAALRAFQALLESQKYGVTTTSSGEEAFEVLGKKNFDLVITDIIMKHMSGLGVLSRVKETAPDTPVIMVTGYVSLKSAIEALRLGAFDYLIKPFEGDELLLRVSRALEQREMKKELMEAQKKALFTATVITTNHEINQPLTAIMGNAGLMLMELEENGSLTPSLKKWIETVIKSVNRISEILDKLKRISHPVLKSYAHNVEMIDLGQRVNARQTGGDEPGLVHFDNEEGKVILVVDDEDVLRHMMAEIVSKMRHRVLIASNGHEALKLFKENKGKVSLVVADLRMPRMGGKELYYKLRKLDPGVRVILSSGYDVDREVHELMDAGASGFIKKPYDIEEFKTVVNKLMDDPAGT